MIIAKVWNSYPGQRKGGGRKSIGLLDPGCGGMLYVQASVHQIFPNQRTKVLISFSTERRRIRRILEFDERFGRLALSLANLDHENKTEIRELFGNLLQILPCGATRV